MGSPASLNLSSSSMPSISALLVSDSGQELLSTLPPELASPSSSASPLPASTLSAFCEWYSAHVHGVLSAALCVLGICSNLVNAVVLTRRTMFGQVSRAVPHLVTFVALVVAHRSNAHCSCTVQSTCHVCRRVCCSLR